MSRSVPLRDAESTGAVTAAEVEVDPTRTAGEYARLLLAARTGEPEALDRLMRRVQDVTYRFSHAVCGHAEDAEDAAQEALFQTYRSVDRIRNPEAFRSWLYRTVKNACLMGRRRRADEPRYFVSLEEPAEDGGPSLDVQDAARDPEQLAEQAGLTRRVRRELQKLPPAYRVVVFLRELEGLSTREVSEVLGISEDNVKTRLHRGRRMLKAGLSGPQRS